MNVPPSFNGFCHGSEANHGSARGGDTTRFAIWSSFCSCAKRYTQQQGQIIKLAWPQPVNSAWKGCI